jgi:hypothetical protein
VIKRFITLHNLKFDGEYRPPGSIVSVPDDQVDRLLELGAISELAEGERILERRRERQSRLRPGQ